MNTVPRLIQTRAMVRNCVFSLTHPYALPYTLTLFPYALPSPYSKNHTYYRIHVTAVVSIARKGCQRATLRT